MLHDHPPHKFYTSSLQLSQSASQPLSRVFRVFRPSVSAMRPLVAACALGLAAALSWANSAWADCTQWNLNTDYLNSPNQKNPNPDSCGNQDVWHFMQGVTSNHDPKTYSLMTQFTTSANRQPFYDPYFYHWAGEELASAGGMPFFGRSSGVNRGFGCSARYMPANTIVGHPASTRPLIIGWKSPVTGTVSVTGGATSLDGGTIVWYVDKNATNLAYGWTANGSSQYFQYGTNGGNLAYVKVQQGDFIYLGIDPYGNFSCDTTALSISINLLPISCKFNDLNGNGVKDPNETGLANESIFIRDNIAANYNGAGFYGRVTDSNGEFDFVAPVASNYTFWTNIPAGKVQTAPVPGESMAPYTANLAAGEALQVCFGIADKTYPLALTKSGTGQGQITSADALLNCGTTCTANYAQNSTVTLTATPAANSQFQGWTGDCSDTLATVTVALDKAKTCNAIFDTAPKATLTVNKNGTGSGIVMTPDFGINCGSICQNTYPLKTPVTLNVIPGANSTFTGWSGDCTGSAPTATVTLDVAKTCTATFASTVKQMLTVSKTGQGEGTIISTPAGISCGKTCGYDFPANSNITLTAYNITGSTFTGWSGDCSGTTSKIVVTLDQAKNCVANFDVKVPPPAGMYSLTVANTGTGQGTITGSTSAINCGSNCLSNFKSGATYWLMAKPDMTSKFVKWTGDCSGTNAAVKVTFTKNLTCTAEFATK